MIRLTDDIKHDNSAFRRTGVAQRLQDLRINTLIITGMQTEFCIDSTVKAAYELGYQVIIPEYGTTPLDTPCLKAEQIYAHYMHCVWNRTAAEVLPLEKVLERVNSGSIT